MHIKRNHKIVLLTVIMMFLATVVFTVRMPRAAADTGEVPLVVLYSQNDNPGTTSSSSQEFPDFPTFTDFIADDFVIPAGQSWSINEVDATGVYFNGPGPADNFNVYFYENSGTLPGTLLATRTAQPFINATGVFQITMASPVVLAPGTYWVSVQAHMSFAAGGQWGWTDRTVQAGSPAAFQNPGGGFGVCPTWGVRQTCLASPAGEPDQMFQLQGTIGGVGTPSPSPTPTPGISPTPTPTPTTSPSPCTGNYTVSQIGGSIVAGTTDTGNHGDDTVTTLALPFPYAVYGTTYTSVDLSSNGNAQFTTGDTTFSNSCLPWTTHDDTVYPYWDDLRTDAQSGCSAYPTGCGIFTSVTGSAPNRILNIEWRTVYFDDPTQIANHELRLYEGQARFDVVYGTVVSGNSTATAGVQKNDSLFAQYFCDGTGGAATGGQSYVLQGCGTPTPAASPTPPATPVVTPTVNPSPSPSCSPSYTTATTTGTITAGGTDIGNHCDDCGTVVNLPFPVSVYGTATSVVTAGSNGDIQFTATPSTKVFWWEGCVPVDPDPATQDPFLNTLFPNYDDLRTDELGACPDCGIFTQTLGSAPNRQFVIRFKTTYFNHAGTAEFQVVLSEGSGTLSVIYGASSDNGLEATSGLQRDLNVFTSFSCLQPTLTPGLRVNYVPTGCPTGSPSPSPTPVVTPTPVLTPTPGVTPTPGLRFCNGTPVDMNLNTTALPYPSTITVAGAPSITGGVIVTLNALWHTFPDNIDILLVGPNGQKFVLMADAGGPIAIPQAAPVTLTLRDFQPTVLPNNGPLTTGTFMPTNWETPVLSFAPPAPPAPYTEPGNQPFPPIGRTLFGTFGLLNPNGVWSLYVRDDGGNPVDPEVLIGQIAGGWCIEFLPPTAAGVSISGRVMTAGGAGVRNARVVVMGNTLPEPLVVTTGSFGYFSVDGLTAGETYVVTVNSTRYTFQAPSRVYNLVDNITDADFVADQQ